MVAFCLIIWWTAAQCFLKWQKNTMQWLPWWKPRKSYNNCITCLFHECVCVWPSVVLWLCGSPMGCNFCKAPLSAGSLNKSTGVVVFLSRASSDSGIRTSSLHPVVVLHWNNLRSPFYQEMKLLDGKGLLYTARRLGLSWPAFIIYGPCQFHLWWNFGFHMLWLKGNWITCYLTLNSNPEI